MKRSATRSLTANTKPPFAGIKRSSPGAKAQSIHLRGVRQNNLKNFDLDLPLGQLIVVTGLSGSGKSSLVFDTVHAEGQRRYVETFSPYTRQFLEMLPRPKVDAVENVRPSIALEQGNTVKTSRSSVGTITELCDYFKVWFAHQSELIDPATGKPIHSETTASIAAAALKKYKGRQLLLCAHLRRPGSLGWEELLQPLIKQGFTRAIIDDQVQRLDDPQTLAWLQQAAGENSAHSDTAAGGDTGKKTAKATKAVKAKTVDKAEHARTNDTQTDASAAHDHADAPHANLDAAHAHTGACGCAGRSGTGTCGNHASPAFTPPATDADHLLVVIDRIAADTEVDTLARFIEAATTVLRLGHGFIDLCEQLPTGGKTAKQKAETKSTTRKNSDAETLQQDPQAQTNATRGIRFLERFTEGLRSPATGKLFAPAVPNLFSYNSPLGACPSCRGFGRIIEIDPAFVVPDKSKTLEEGAIAAFNGEVFKHSLADLKRAAKKWKEKIPFDVPYSKLTPSQLDYIWKGDPAYRPEDNDWESLWYGIDGFFRWIEANTYKMHMRVFLSKFRSYVTCPDCHGTRLTDAANNWRWQGYRLADLYNLPVSDLLPLLREHALPKLDASKLGISHPARLALEGILTRLNYLQTVGLGYLHLDRASRTLSGGESQRVNLTACLGTSLVQTLFVLDEPSIGLHARDVDQLISILHALRDQGNTVLVVEHDESVIAAADHVIEIGPQAGAGGGQVVYEGAGSAIADAPASLTGKYLSGVLALPAPEERRPIDAKTPHLKLKAVTLHNLNKLDVELPLQRFVCLSGVSGSGKSTLLKHALHQGLLQERGAAQEKAAQIAKISGLEQIGEIVLVDQSPMSRTPRSNAAIMTGAWTRIRELYATTEAAQQQGFTASNFSFNHESGRCEHCEGLGYVEVSMQFLSDIYTPCPVCEGKRFRQEVLDIRWKEKSVSDLLAMSAAEAVEFFAGEKKITTALGGLLNVGLGYLPLGQPVNTLSGGESQRLKLLKFIGGLKKKNELPALILLDEPTTGLHRDDVGRLLQLLQNLVQAGHSLVVIEHQQDVLKAADWIIELGPEAGAEGGIITFTGTPEALAKLPKSRSATAPYLKEALSNTPKRPAQTKVKTTAKTAPPTAAASAKSSKTSRAQSAKPEGATGAKPDAALSAAPTHHTATELEIRGAREHNLKNINVDIAHNRLTVVTGVSGSGKSTLAFDIVFAEGQRRFLESMSSYARQFVEQLSRPQVDSITGIAPTVAIEQRVTHGSRKSTVATITEVAQYLRLLYARVGTQYSPQSLQPVISMSAEALRKHLEGYLKSPACQQADAVYLCAPLIRSRKGHHEPLANWAKAHGYPLLRCDGKLVEVAKFQKLDRYKEHDIELALPLRTSRKEPLPRGSALQAQLDAALKIGKGSCFVLAGKDAVLGWLSTERTDPVTGEAFPELDPKHFSWNSIQGWCPTCHGYGTIDEWMLGREDFAHLKGRKDIHNGDACPDCHGTRLNRIARAVRIPLRSGWEKTTATADKSKPTRTARSSVNKSHPQRPQTLGQLLQGALTVADTISLGELLALPPSAVLAALHQLKLSTHEGVIAQAIIPEIEERLRFMDEVGLGYLGLDRATNTLSGGEAQRIRLAAQLGSQLSGVLYVLDEPSIGLHARDNAALIRTLHALREKGNTLLVVEHDDDTMRAADEIIDLGPGAGRHGGEVLANGTYDSLLRNERSLTGRFLRDGIPHPLRGSYRPLEIKAGNGRAASQAVAPSRAQAKRQRVAARKQAQKADTDAPAISNSLAAPQWLTLAEPRLRNLRGDTLRLPLARLSTVCGPSGAGKSTLINDLLQSALEEALGGKKPVAELLWDKVPASSPLRTRFRNQTGSNAWAAASAPQTKTTGSSAKVLSRSTAAAKKVPQRKAKIAPRSANTGNGETPLFEALSGADKLANVIAVDQSPIGKTPRSTPATYIGAWDIIRSIFAEAPEAKWRGFSTSTFSFNTANGRCQHCLGAGRIKLEMAFLPEAYEVCPHCDGRRFGPDVLSVTWRGKTIADVLDMSIEEAAAFFESHSRLHALLSLMAETGLGYLRLGQSSPTLSGGEAQRLKLVRELSQGLPTWKDQRRGIIRHNIYLLEEPTIGLHLSDCQRLIELLQRLVDQGHTVVVIEHHLDLIAEADYVVEIGPGGGEAGGQILYQGNLAGLLRQKGSPTAPFLRDKVRA